LVAVEHGRAVLDRQHDCFVALGRIGGNLLAAPADKPSEEKATEDKAAATEAAPAEKTKDGTAAKPTGEQPAAPATDTDQPLPDA
ncbi:hypothetical protein ACC764_38670, partial [Rhizobium ruizarguesonis]